MPIASLIVKTKAGFEEQTAATIESIEGLTVHSVTENKEIIVIAEAPTSQEIGALGSAIEADENVWSVMLAYSNIETDLEQ